MGTPMLVDRVEQDLWFVVSKTREEEEEGTISDDLDWLRTIERVRSRVSN
jgi:hypothetical protein